MIFKSIWRYQTIQFGESLGDLKEITQVFDAAMPADGSQIRLLLDNRFNQGRMAIGSITVSTGSETASLTLNGSEEITLKPGETVYTDSVSLAVRAGERLQVRIHFREASGIQGLCQTWAARSWKTAFLGKGGNPVNGTDLFPWLRQDVHKPTVAAGLSQIDLLTDESVRTIAMFGDSITHMSYYSDALLERILAEHKGKAVTVNAGIGGNRLCHDASSSPDLGIHSSVFGNAGYRRFKQDLFGTMQPDTILMLEGINDITHPFQYGRPDQVPSAEEFCGHYAEVIGCAHRHGARILIGTIMPENVFAGETWFEDSERLRKEINGWIRTQELSDGVIDFEAVAASPSGSLKDGFHLDDLHPNEAGGREMAAAVPLSKLLEPLS
ncbi:MAG: hypothetical protein IJ106_15430 [Parasporobacterium sp.]|nr:hypothetical protein [Parasporobacterium sp.]